MRKQSWAPSALLLFSVHAGAASYSTDTLDITVSGESYKSSTGDYFLGLVGERSGAPYEVLSDGVKFSPDEYIYGAGAEGTYWSAARALIFNVTDMAFSAKPGYKITGYEMSFNGQLWLSNLATAAVGGEMMPTADDLEYVMHDNYSPGWTPYSFSSAIAADNPAGGNVSARGGINFDAPPSFTIGCCDPWGDPTLVVDQYSGAGITIDSVTIRASVTAVPEPEMYLMFLAGLGAIAWRARRSAGPWTAA
jgi:hypothetical protein